MTAFNREAARRRLGPAAVTAVETAVAAAPPLSAETRMQLAAVFGSAPKAAATSGTQPLAA